LRRLLQELPPNLYEVILIDTGKGLDPLAVNALAAADEVVIMVTPGRLELDAIDRLNEHVALVRDEVLIGSIKALPETIIPTLIVGVSSIILLLLMRR
jgi:cellulose biosynthesis protein BcsQ